MQLKELAQSPRVAVGPDCRLTQRADPALGHSPCPLDHRQEVCQGEGAEELSRIPSDNSHPLLRGNVRSSSGAQCCSSHGKDPLRKH